MPTFDIGVTYDIDPLPLVAENTRFYPAGAVTIALEARRVDTDVLKEGFGQDVVAEHAVTFDDVGVSLHVLGTQDQKEYLRFDCFDNDAHYHYILWGVRQTVVPFDKVAGGDMLTWALETIGLRLGDMLSFAGAPELAAAVDRDVVSRTLDQVAPDAHEAQRALRAAVA